MLSLVSLVRMSVSISYLIPLYVQHLANSILSVAELVSHFLTWFTSPDADFLKGKFVWANGDVDELKAQSDDIKDSLLLRVLLNGAIM